MNYAIVIPARYESTRLPGKPLVEIDGTPMIVRTWQRCVEATERHNVYVATDDDRVKQVCESYDIQVVMTSSRCLTGTDRVAEVAKSVPARTFINVQGDEPLFNPEDIRTLISEAEKFPDDVLNGYCPISDEAEFRSSHVPKVVFDSTGRLLYMSRAPIPGSKLGTFRMGWRQVCAYSFPRQALEGFTIYREKTPLEAQEDIEILRFLEMGMDVRMIPMSADSIPVDNPEDIAVVEAALRMRANA